MNYYESAEGLLLTWDSAKRVLDEHGVGDYYDFWDEVQPINGLYDAQEILIWLGY